ncbi:MAG: DUF1801 domain-containing protein [Coriobacteriia bacterium]|nr:DUF1801 domain-containing protein [Coriobacteriia bacterium]
MQAWPELVKKISYGMLMYALSGDFRHWVCAIDAHKKPFRLRFLYGTLLEDPARRLRSGTSHLSNLDFPSLEDIDVMLVASYVREAASRHDEFKAQLGEA